MVLGPGPSYDRGCLLRLYPGVPPAPNVQRRIRELGLWTTCRLLDSRCRNVAYLRSYRGRRAGRPGRPVPTLRPVGNGAFVVATRQPVRRSSNGDLPRPPTLRHCLRSSADSPSEHHSRQLVFSSLNIRSLTRGIDDLLEVRHDRSIDVMFLVETWHDAGSVCISRLRSLGFQVVERARPRRPEVSTHSLLLTNHGGVAVVGVPGVRVSLLNVVSDPSSFELLCTRITSGTFTCVALVIYRTGPVTSAFFEELSDALERIVGYNEVIYIVGDLNIHLNLEDDLNSRRLTELFDAFGIVVHNTGPTHDRGNRIDIVASRSDLPPLSVEVFDAGLSDHRLLQWTVSARRAVPTIISGTRRPWHKLDITALSAALRESPLCRPECWTHQSVDELALLYDSEITSLLDSLIPARAVICRRRPSDPWFDKECRLSKRRVRRLERIASKSKTTEDNLNWTSERRAYRQLLQKKRGSFWKKRIDAEKSSPRQLWRSIDELMGRGSTPGCDTINAQQFHDYFEAKVAGVRAATDDAPSPCFSLPSSEVHLMSFTPVTVEEIATAVRALPDKCCALDPFPTSTLKNVIDDLAPFLAHLVNHSLSTGSVPGVFKEAYISPRLKKVDLDPTDVRSYRPISNLSVISKLLERIVARQLLAHLNSNDLLPGLQSAYRANHSTETAVLKVLSDILLDLDSGDLSALVLLDLSAAFDTVDHEILLRRLDSSYLVGGTAHSWFESYLFNRRQHVRTNSSSSFFTTMICGVPQGSVLGAILFLIYGGDLQRIIEKHGLRPHLYADDSQIYGSCRPSTHLELQSRISACIDDVADWMRSNRLQLNSAKTEILWSASSRRLHQLPHTMLRVGTEHVTPSVVVRDLGILLDSDVSMKSHVMRTVSTCFFVLRQLRTIRRSVSRPVFQSLVVSLVFSRLDYGNATLIGIPQYLLQRLQSVMNAAARLVYSSPRSSHITPFLRQLHWLKAKQRIEFKVAVLVYKCLHGSAPHYLSGELRLSADVQGRSRLRSATSSQLVVRQTRRSTLGDRSFLVAGPRLWNTLPQHITSASSLQIFKSRLKTYLFSISFP
jgi:hypothetical protein